MSLPVQHPSYDSPVSHLKGEVLDLEFTLDSDHRKRRRNRTTQSCLNCHTSKRKVRRPTPLSPFNPILTFEASSQCDRKRPCQRCIQLGLVQSAFTSLTPYFRLKHTVFRQGFASTRLTILLQGGLISVDRGFVLIIVPQGRPFVG